MIARFLASFSLFGLFLGLIFLCASLTPSLLPRVPSAQGGLSGVSFAVGYGSGLLLQIIWRSFGFPASRAKGLVLWGLVAAGMLLTINNFSRLVLWQNSIRVKMEMPVVDAGYPLFVGVAAIGVALLLILFGRGVLKLGRIFGNFIGRVMPARAAYSLGFIVALFVVASLFNNFVLQKAMRVADQIFAQMDARETVGIAAPTGPFVSGGSASIVNWDDIGTNGKDFLTDGPHAAEIEAFTGRPALEPIRVYAGFGSGQTHEERAKIAVDDLIALGGFERSTLIVATPTGTGWLDGAAVQPLPYMLDGDVAIVSSQYTYVPSWFSILVEPDRSRDAARALFNAVYGHWTRLPQTARPELYLFGLSLGALGSEASADLVTVFPDPIHGALWSGPPFASAIWRSVTDGRNEDSPEWLPEFRDGALVRFMNARQIASPEGADWGKMRFLYLQYGSDPMVFFAPNLLFSRPDWLDAPRSHDVSEHFRWYPLVTFLQLGFDVPMATTPPSGYGHTYHAVDYIDAWKELIAPKGWTETDHERLLGLYTDFVAYPI